MNIIPGFQKKVYLNVFNGYPGDLASNVTQDTDGAQGYFSLGDVIVGNCCFIANNGNQVASSSSVSGATQVIAGFVLRNQGLAPMTWTDSNKGYGMLVPDGKQATVANNGSFLGIITGVDDTGVADHVPVIGESIWVKLLDGSLASAPKNITSVTGYVQALGWNVKLINGNTPAIVGANQTFASFGGMLRNS